MRHGIDPTLAAKIIRSRQQAPFKGGRDLIDRVPGIGGGHAAECSAYGPTVHVKKVAAAPEAAAVAH